MLSKYSPSSVRAEFLCCVGDGVRNFRSYVLITSIHLKMLTHHESDVRLRKEVLSKFRGLPPDDPLQRSNGSTRSAQQRAGATLVTQLLVTPLRRHRTVQCAGGLALKASSSSQYQAASKNLHDQHRGLLLAPRALVVACLCNAGLCTATSGCQSSWGHAGMSGKTPPWLIEGARQRVSLTTEPPRPNSRSRREWP